MEKTDHSNGRGAVFGVPVLTLKMKLLSLFFATVLLQVSANEGYAQSTKISVDMNAATIKQVIDKIEDMTEFRFLYSSPQIALDQKVDIKIKNKRIAKVLRDLFKNTGISYEIYEKQIILKPGKIDLIQDDKADDGVLNDPPLQQTVSGTVTDDTGQPLPGASVIEKGTTNGTQTDFDGKFSINISDDNAVLSISYIGFATQEIAVNGQSSISVMLKESTAALEEVVVVGYGTKTKGSLTGSTSTVRADQFQSRPQTQVVTSLQGAVPGVLVTRGTGDIGNEENSIQIRGITSPTLDNDGNLVDAGVLIVIDGIPQRENNANALNNINPQDIESITVLKDAQAAIYGARAAGGVMLVTTKKGRSGKPTFSYDTNVSLNVPILPPQKTNLIQHMAMNSEGFENDGNLNHFFVGVNDVVSAPGFQFTNDVIPGPFGDTPDIWLGHTDWEKVIWGSAFMQSHNLSVSGSTERSNYFLSVGLLDQNSTLQFGTNSNNRYFARAKYDFDVIDDVLSLGTNISLERQKIKRPGEYDGITDRIRDAWSSIPLYNPEGNYYNFGGFTPPHAWAIDGGDDVFLQYRTRLQFNAKLSPLPNLTIDAQFSTNLDIEEAEFQEGVFQFYSWGNVPTFPNRNNGNAFTSRYTRNTHQVSNVFATYDKAFGKHNINLVAGTSHEEIDDKGFEAWRRNVFDGLRVFDNGDPEQQFNSDSKSQFAISSYFGRASYNFGRKYLLDAQYRRDGSSRFADGFRWGNFFGVSGGWVVSEESFMKNVDFLDQLKFRVSYGQLGNQNNVGRFDHFSRIIFPNDGDNPNLPFGTRTGPGRTQVAREAGPLASRLRSWETVNTYNYGVDFAMFGSKLSGSFEYFFKNTTDILYAQDFPQVLGIGAPTINGGELEVTGVDITLNWRDKIGDFEYFIKGNYFDNKGVVTSLPDRTVVADGFNTLVEGYATGSYFGLEYEGLIKDQATLDAYKNIQGVPSNLRIGDAMYADLDGDGVIEPGKLYREGDPDSGDLIHLGNNNIRHSFFLTLGGAWKGFDMSAQFQGVGQWKVDQLRNSRIRPVGGDWWNQPYAYQVGQTFHETERPNAPWPKLTANGGIDDWNYRMSTAPYKLQNNPYVRLKNLQFGYTLPTQVVERIGLSKLRLYFSGTDLWEWDKLPKGFDPEQPFFFAQTPFNRLYSLGLNVTF